MLQLDRSILALALPIIVANATTPLVGLVDTAMMGHLERADYVAALTIGATMISSLFWIVSVLKMAVTGVVAQARGREDSTAIGAATTTTLRQSWLIALAMILTTPLLTYLTNSLMPSTAEINQLAREYVSIRLIGAPAALTCIVCAGILIGLSKSVHAMWLGFIVNGVNIVLDLVFVAGLGWKVGGVAWASVIAECIGAVYALSLILRFTNVSVFTLVRAKYEKLNAHASLHSDLLIRSLLLQCIHVALTRASGELGPETLAVNGLLLQIALFTYYGLDGFAHAAETRVGAAWGRRDYALVRTDSLQCFYWGVILAVLCTFVLFVLRSPIIALLTDIPTLIDQSKRYYAWVAAAPLVAVAAFTLDGIYIGTTQSRALRNGMLIATVVFVVALFVLSLIFNNHGIWLAYHISLIVRTITLLAFWPFGEVRLAKKPNP